MPQTRHLASVKIFTMKDFTMLTGEGLKSSIEDSGIRISLSDFFEAIIFLCLIMVQRNDDKAVQNSYRGTGTPSKLLIMRKKNFSEIKKPCNNQGF
jgi:hypothetical protein